MIISLFENHKYTCTKKNCLLKEGISYLDSTGRIDEKQILAIIINLFKMYFEKDYYKKNKAERE